MDVLVRTVNGLVIVNERLVDLLTNVLGLVGEKNQETLSLMEAKATFPNFDCCSALMAVEPF